MRTIALRLHPGADLKAELLALATRERVQAGWVLTCVGSLSRVRLRLAGGAEHGTWQGPFEIVALTGTLSGDGGHLHLAAAAGVVVTGYVDRATGTIGDGSIPLVMIPFAILALAIVGTVTFWTMVIALSIASWLITARVVRGELAIPAEHDHLAGAGVGAAGGVDRGAGASGARGDRPRGPPRG